MSSPNRQVRTIVATALAVAGALALFASPAMARNHNVKIKEVYAGSAGQPNSDYVELEMYASGEEFVAGLPIKIYDSSGALIHTALFDTDATTGDQRTILLASDSADFTTQFPGVTPDTASADMVIPQAGGAVCYVSQTVGATDCVSWGTYSGPSSLESDMGTPAAALTNTQALRRSIAAGCSTQFEPGDDTDVSSADFSLQTPAPHPSTDAPIDHACVPPDTFIDTQPANPTLSTSASFTYHSGEGGVTFECKLDAEVFASCSGVGKSYAGPLSPGPHTFQVRAVSAINGTDGSPASYTWTITAPDVTPPDTVIDTTPANPVSSTSASFTYHSTEGSSTFECKIDAGPFTSCLGTGQMYSSLGQGPHTFQVRATDASSNVDPSPASYTWVVDTVAPQTTIDTNPSNPTTGTAASFTYHSSEASSSFVCKLDSEVSFTSCSGAGKNYPGPLADGSHTFSVKATDTAGNQDATEATFTWTIDTTGPDTTIDTGPTGTVASAAPNFTYHASEGSVTFECKLDAAPFTSCLGAGQGYSGLASGSHTFQVRAIDALGNPDASPASRTWTIDLTPPNTTITKGPAASVKAKKTYKASFTFTATEPGSFECKLDKGAFAACTSPKKYTLKIGKHTFTVRAKDALGNIDASPAVKTVTVKKKK